MTTVQKQYKKQEVTQNKKAAASVTFSQQKDQSRSCEYIIIIISFPAFSFKERKDSLLAAKAVEDL